MIVIVMPVVTVSDGLQIESATLVLSNWGLQGFYMIGVLL